MRSRLISSRKPKCDRFGWGVECDRVSIFMTLEHDDSILLFKESHSERIAVVLTVRCFGCSENHQNDLKYC